MQGVYLAGNLLGHHRASRNIIDFGLFSHRFSDLLFIDFLSILESFLEPFLVILASFYLTFSSIDFAWIFDDFFIDFSSVFRSFEPQPPLSYCTGIVLNASSQNHPSAKKFDFYKFSHRFL